MWTSGGHAHIPVSPALDATGGARLENALEAVDGVHWAAWNGVLSRVIVAFDPDRVRPDELIVVVDRVERERPAQPDRRPPKDIDGMLGHGVALAGDVLAAGVALAGRAVRLPPVPIEMTALPAVADLFPGLQRRLAAHLGARRTETAGALGSALINGAAQAPFAPLTDAALRVALLAEERACRGANDRLMPALLTGREAAQAPPLSGSPRPGPLPDGPIERYVRRAGLVAVLAAAVILPTGGRRAARAAMIAAPRAAHVGREAYAATLGRVLAQRGVVTLDNGALRRLDRIDAVVLDASALTSGRSVVADVLAVEGEPAQARAQALRLFDGEQPRRTVHRDEWTLAPLAQLPVAAPPDLASRLRRARLRRRDALGLAAGGRLVAVVTVQPALAPMGEALAVAARKVGRLIIAGGGRQLAQRLGADTTAGGSRLAASVRALQEQGHGVALVASRNDAALAAADCGIGLLTEGHRPPWGAHLLCGPGAENAWLVLEATTLARRVSSRSARLAVFGSAASALVGFAAPGRGTARAAPLPVGAAALVALARGAWSARSVGRRPVPLTDDAAPWHALEVEEVLQELGTSDTGLSDEQADRRRRRSAAADEPDGGSPLLAAVVEELDNPLTMPLAAGAGLSAATGSTTDAILVLSVLAANALLGGAQRVSADRVLSRLLAAGALRVRLRRGGGVRLAAADDLVAGDVIALEPGDAVPADCRLIACTGLEMDESSLTGESLPVGKSVAACLAPAVADRTSIVYAGTTVAAGTATAVVVATGRSTEAGRSGRAALDREPTGGVEARLRRMTARSIPVAAGAAAALLGTGMLRGRTRETASASVALAVAAIPEGLPFVATVAQLAAARRLAARNVLVRQPNALEALARVNMICFDKTGTLTEGRIRLRLVSDGHTAEPVEQLAPARRLVLAAALRATPPPNDDQVLPHPTDRAVAGGGGDTRITTAEGAPRWRALRELPFEPGRGFHAVLGRTPGRHLISVKGAPEIVLPRCVAWRRGGADAPLTDADRKEIDSEVDRLARHGWRVLAVAERAASGRRSLADERVERLEFLGLLALADPVRPAAAQAVTELRRAGVDVVMLTGDHPSTAESIAAELGILDARGVITGPDLDGADEVEIDARVANASVFARVSPTHKVAIVAALRRAGRVVAVTGDGANDAPAIRLADVGIALGDRGTTAAREAADVVVMDDRLETIVHAVIEGRALWMAVRDAVALLLGGNLGEMAFTVGSSLLSARPTLNARQLLLINLVTDLLPALTIAARRPRHVTSESLLVEGPDASLGAALTDDVIRRAVATATAAYGGWLAARVTGSRDRAGTVALGALAYTQLAQTALASRGDGLVLGAVALSAVALAVAVQTPVVSGFFGSRPLGPVAWSIVLGAAASGAGLGAAIRRIR